MEEIVQDYVRSSGLKLSRFRILKVLKRPLSVVTRLLIKTTDGQTQVVYVKSIREQAVRDMATMARRDYETSLFWWKRFKDCDAYRVIEPLYLNPENCIIITRESKGQDLQIYLTKLGQLFPSAQAQAKVKEMIGLVGGWLSYFQTIPVEDESVPLVDLDYLLKYVNKRMDRIVSKTKIGFDAKSQEGVNRFITERWQDVNPKENKICYLHSDLSLSNVLVDESHITVLDFTKRETGSAFKDLSRFYHQLTLLSYKPTFQNKFIHDLQESFLVGYGEHALDKHPLFEIYLMTHIINHLGKSARFWEQAPRARMYNRWVVYKVMKQIKQIV